MKRFLLSEEGGMVGWIVGAVIMGLGAIPIIMGIANAISQKTIEGEESIRNMIDY